jgi:hypothetical protein
MRRSRWSFVLFAGLFFSYLLLPNGVLGETYPLSVRYEPSKGKEFPSLQQKIGPHLGLAPFKDDRVDPSRIGVHVSLGGVSTYFKSEPFPLEKALTDSLSGFLLRSGIKTVPLSPWDGSAEILRTMETDSVLMVEIKQFWTEGKADLFRTLSKTSIRLLIHLGVKKEGKVFSKNVELEKEVTVARLTPGRLETMINQMLSDIFDAYFSNPY